MKTSENSKSENILSRIGRFFGRFFIWVAATLIIVLIGLYVFFFMVNKGPSPRIRDLFVASAKESSVGGVVADIYLSQAQIDEILSKNKTTEFEEITNTSLVKLNTSENETKNETVAETGTLIDPDGDGIDIFDVHGDTYKGKMMVVYDPSRVKVATLDHYDYNAPGLTLSQLVQKYDCVAGVNGGKYDDETLEDYLKDSFKSKGFKEDFIDYFSEDIYEKILNSFETKNTQSLQNVSVSFQILKVINDITHDNKFKFSEWISYLLKRNHYHKISDIIPLNEKLNSKADIYHIHNNLTRNQISRLQYILENNRLYKKIDFDIFSNYVLENEKINLLNLNIMDFDNKKIEIDLDELQFIYDNQIILSVKDSDLIKYDEKLDYFELSTINLTPGHHELCVRYKDTYSEDVNLFIKNRYNLFNFDVWLSSNISNFDNFNVESISLSKDWSDIGDFSIKVICDGKEDYQALITPKMDVSINSIVFINVTIYNPKSEVIVRLFESSIASYVDMVVPASNIPKKVNFSKKALTDKMQLLLISRVKQVFYADNFEFLVIN